MNSYCVAIQMIYISELFLYTWIDDIIEKNKIILHCVENNNEIILDIFELMEKFKIQNVNFKLPEGFKLYSTFRIQESNDWSGSRQAFEQSLVDAGIRWFIYIKFDENNHPLVIGKSGSLLVNSRGSDISFSTDVNDGPARRFLHENSIQWNKTQIAIKKCNSEKEAYILESKLQRMYNLFGS